MSHLYHLVPEGLAGSRLYPLLELESRLPDVYRMQRQKYQDHPKRKRLPERPIPGFPYRRGDVLHCSPVDPRVVYTAFSEIFSQAPDLEFLEIPEERLLGIDLIYFDLNHPDYEFGLEEDPPSVFRKLDGLSELENHRLPPEAVGFWKQWKAKGKDSAPIWGGIPHVFVAGAVNIEGLRSLSWKKPIK